MAPKDEDELRHMLATALACGRPGGAALPARQRLRRRRSSGPPRALPVGKAEVLRGGRDGLVWAIGTMATEALRRRRAARRRGRAGPDRGQRPLRQAARRRAAGRPAAPRLAADDRGGERARRRLRLGGHGGGRRSRGAAAWSSSASASPTSSSPTARQEILRARLDLDVEGIMRRARAFFPAATDVAGPVRRPRLA